MKVKLRAKNGKQAGTTFLVWHSPFLVGRHKECPFRINNPQVSLRHCVLTVKDGAVRIKDLDSTNGTFVNGEQVEGEWVLQPADVIQVGPLELELVVEAAGVTDQSEDKEYGSTLHVIPPYRGNQP